jgi:hypothetical protein
MTKATNSSVGHAENKIESVKRTTERVDIWHPTPTVRRTVFEAQLVWKHVAAAVCGRHILP